MADRNHCRLLRKGLKKWNKWRDENPGIEPDLSSANLSKENLSRFNLRNARLDHANLHSVNLSHASLRGASLERANLREADLSGAGLDQVNLMHADLYKADLRGADLTDALLNNVNLALANLTGVNLYGRDLSNANLWGAYLNGADLGHAWLNGANLGGANFHGARLSKAQAIGAWFTHADFSRANLSGADLTLSLLVDTNFEEADLSRCEVYGIAAWNLRLAGAKQNDIVITQRDEPTITVDNLEIAQFIYLLLNNQKVRDVIDTITSKAVLILGRFTPERKVILDGLRDELRKHDYLPILFDFERPSSQNLTETVSTLAHMARFVIADITDAKSIAQELQRIIPGRPSLPVQPLILSSEYEYGMFKDFLDYPWVLAPYRYENLKQLLTSLAEKVIAPAASKANEIEERRKAFEEVMGK